jgi:Raf kinase inhibitor-like YbhB/YbcL family protein
MHRSLALLLPAAVLMASEAHMTLTLRSPAFAAGAAIPAEYTCDGANHSPPLEWSGAPAGTRSFAFILDDPDAPDPKAPKTTWVHWVLYDMPASATGLARAVDPKQLPAGTREGTNSAKHAAYGGPCPPTGRHRYFHKLYALDTTLGDLGRPTVEKLQSAMKGHILAETELIGTYQRGH